MGKNVTPAKRFNSFTPYGKTVPEDRVWQATNINRYIILFACAYAIA